MLDPLTSLTLATSILSIIEFSGKVLTRANRIRKSPDGTAIEIQELEYSVSRLLKLSSSLNTSKLRKDETILSEDQEEAIKLGNSCKSLATEITETLQGYKPGGQQGKRTGFKLALKYEWQKDKLATCEKDLKNKQEEARDFIIRTLCELCFPTKRCVHVSGLISKAWIERHVLCYLALDSQGTTGAC